MTALIPSYSGLPCDHCGSKHGADFLFHGSRFCCECMSSLTSWLLDGGMVEEPDLFAYVLDDDLVVLDGGRAAVQP